MNRIFRHKYTIFSLMAAMAMLMVSATGCIMDNEEPGTPDDEGLMMVSFRVVTPNQSAASRGITPPTRTDKWDNNGEAGTDFDNLLLADQLKVFITDDQSNSLAEVTMLSLSGPSSTGEREYIGFITGDDTFTNVHDNGKKLHVIANAGNGLTDTNGEINNDKSFKKSGQGFDAIPMWGVATVNFNGMTKGERFDAGEVWLLRAMAKVEIQVSPDDDNIIDGLNSASLPGVNGTGYLLPTGWDGIGQTKELSYSASYNPYILNEENKRDLTLSSTGEGKNSKIVFYLPECENPNDDANELKIHLTYNTDKTDDILFRAYGPDGKPTGDPYNIVRNHLYRFTVKATISEKIQIICSVTPWTAVDVGPEYGDQ